MKRRSTKYPDRRWRVSRDLRRSCYYVEWYDDSVGVYLLDGTFCDTQQEARDIGTERYGRKGMVKTLAYPQD